MSIIDGYYDGIIKGVEIEDDDFNEGGMVACFDVDLEPTGAVRCRHRSHGDHADKTLDVLGVLGLPAELKSFAHLGRVVGQTVRVRVKTSDKGRQNSYIVTPKKAAVLDADEINRRLNKEELPF